MEKKKPQTLHLSISLVYICAIDWILSQWVGFTLAFVAAEDRAAAAAVATLPSTSSSSITLLPSSPSPSRRPAFSSPSPLTEAHTRKFRY